MDSNSEQKITYENFFKDLREAAALGPLSRYNIKCRHKRGKGGESAREGTGGLGPAFTPDGASNAAGALKAAGASNAAGALKAAGASNAAGALKAAANPMITGKLGESNLAVFEEEVFDFNLAKTSNVFGGPALIDLIGIKDRFGPITPNLQKAFEIYWGVKDTHEEPISYIGPGAYRIPCDSSHKQILLGAFQTYKSWLSNLDKLSKDHLNPTTQLDYVKTYINELTKVPAPTYSCVNDMGASAGPPSDTKSGAPGDCKSSDKLLKLLTEIKMTQPAIFKQVSDVQGGGARVPASPPLSATWKLALEAYEALVPEFKALLPHPVTTLPVSPRITEARDAAGLLSPEEISDLVNNDASTAMHRIYAAYKAALPEISDAWLPATIRADVRSNVLGHK